MVLPAWGFPCVSHHNPLTTVVYKVQMIPVDRSDAQMSNPVTAKHTSLSGLPHPACSYRVQLGLLAPPLPTVRPWFRMSAGA